MHDAVAGMPVLEGVLLQWSHLFQPYALNFVQYRKVVNLTLTAAGADTVTPYGVLPMVFQDVQQFTVPQSVLAEGTFYEFRQGFPFDTYTYYSDSVVVKTFDASSPYVNHVTPLATNQSLSVYWQVPEYSSGLVSYRIRVLYLGYGNGGASNAATWNVSKLNVFATMQLLASQTSFFVGCDDGGSGCLVPYTKYVLEFTGVRDTGDDMPVYVYTSTKHTVIAARKDNTAAMSLYIGPISVTLLSPISAVYSNTPINDTVFANTTLISARGDIKMTLYTSTVTSFGQHNVSILMTKEEHREMIKRVYAIASFSPLSLKFGNTSIAVTMLCM